MFARKTEGVVLMQSVTGSYGTNRNYADVAMHTRLCLLLYSQTPDRY
jgi:hypothetical protein